MIVIIAILVGASACSPRWYYRFREEPTVAPTTDVSTETEERQSITNQYGYESLNDTMKKAYQVLDEYVQRDYSERFTLALNNGNERAGSPRGVLAQQQLAL